MTASELMAHLGAEILSNKVRHPQTGVVLARVEGSELELTPEGIEVAASLPAKTTRAKAAPAVESVEVASDASDASAPAEASPPDAAPAE